MRKLRYHLVDVFTTQRFGGNQLAVFTNGRGLPTDLMQSIAKELNLSETTFVLPPQDPGNDFWVRIFTPAAELPMAGHPTVGTAFVLAWEQLIAASDAASDAAPDGGQKTVHFEEGVGTIPVTLTFEDGRPGLIKMSQPLPKFGPIFEDRAAMAAILSIKANDIDAAHPLETVSCGVPFLYVPVKNLAAIQAIKVRHDLWEAHLKDFATPHIFAFTMETETERATVHSRMFAPAFGIAEDPATGAASGPLGAYLVKHKLVQGAPIVTIIGEQGLEMGRPSFIQIDIEQEAGEISGVYVGGQSVYVGEGFIQL